MAEIGNEGLTRRHQALFGAVPQCIARDPFTAGRAAAGPLQAEASSIASSDVASRFHRQPHGTSKRRRSASPERSAAYLAEAGLIPAEI